MFFVVYLESKRYIAVKKDWISNPIIGEKSKVFYSKNNEATADFSVKRGFYFYTAEDSVYDAFVCRQFDGWATAMTYARKSRVRKTLNYGTNEKMPDVFDGPVEKINLCSDSEDDPNDEHTVDHVSPLLQDDSSSSMNQHYDSANGTPTEESENDTHKTGEVDKQIVERDENSLQPLNSSQNLSADENSNAFEQATQVNTSAQVDSLSPENNIPNEVKSPMAQKQNDKEEETDATNEILVSEVDENNTVDVLSESAAKDNEITGTEEIATESVESLAEDGSEKSSIDESSFDSSSSSGNRSKDFFGFSDQVFVPQESPTGTSEPGDVEITDNEHAVSSSAIATEVENATHEKDSNNSQLVDPNPSTIGTNELVDAGRISPLEHNDSSSQMFDNEFAKSFSYSENQNGTRFYMNGLISLNGDQMRKLKSMNKAVIFDSTFVSYALSAIFGDDILKISFASGQPPNFTDTVQAQLEANKLNFIHDLFVERVNGDVGRERTFSRLVNKKCNNLRS